MCEREKGRVEEVCRQGLCVCVWQFVHQTHLLRGVGCQRERIATERGVGEGTDTLPKSTARTHRAHYSTEGGVTGGEKERERARERESARERGS